MRYRIRKFVFYALLALTVGAVGMPAGCAGFVQNQAIEHFNQGYALQNQGKYNEAIAEYDKAIELNKNFANAYSNRGCVYYIKKEYDRAIADYTRAIELDLETAVHYGGRGSAYFNKKQYELAIQDFNRALELDPQSAVSSTNRDAAISLLTDASEFNRQGTILADAGKYEEAITLFSTSVAVYPYFASAYTNRGLVYIVKKEYALAITDFDSAIKLNSEYALAYSGRGLAYIYTERYEEAVADLDKALQIDLEDADNWNNMGVALEQLGELDEAEESFEIALELDPNNENAKNNLEVLQAGGKPPGIKASVWMSYIPPIFEKAWEGTTESGFVASEKLTGDEPVDGIGTTREEIEFTGKWVSDVPRNGLIIQGTYPQRKGNLYASGTDPEDADIVDYYDVEWKVKESGNTFEGPMTITWVRRSGRFAKAYPAKPSEVLGGTVYAVGTRDATGLTVNVGGMVLKCQYLSPGYMQLTAHQPGAYQKQLPSTAPGVPGPIVSEMDMRIRMYLRRVE